MLKLVDDSIIVGSDCQEYGITNFNNSVFVNKDETFGDTLMCDVIHVQGFQSQDAAVENAPELMFLKVHWRGSGSKGLCR